MAGYRTLAIAAARGRLGFALLENEQLADWGLSQVAASSTQEAARITNYWLAHMKPEVIVTECIASGCRKRGKTIEILEAINKVATDVPILNVTVSKVQAFQNKYEEARALAKRFPELKPKLAEKPAIWETEPRRMIIFEAVSMALQIRQGESY